jgi:hypothetical protein
MHAGFWQGGLKEKRPLERPRYKWEATVKMDVKEMKCKGLNRIIWLRI